MDDDWVMPSTSSPIAIAPVIPAEGVRRESALPFWCLMFFTFIVLVGPQFLFPVLQPLHLAKVAAGLAIAVYVFDRLAQRRPLTVNVPAVRLILWFVLLATLSIPLSHWPGGSLDLLLTSFSKSLAIFFLLANTVNTVRRMKLMIGSMAMWGVILSVAAIRDFWVGNFGLAGLRIASFYSALTTNANDLALTLNLILALVIGLYAAINNPFLKLFLLAAMGLSAAGVIVSFSRGGFLTLVAILLVPLIKQVREGRLAPLAGFVVVVLAVPFLFPEGYGDRLYSILDFGYDPTGSARARWQTLGIAVSIIIENPLFGVGFGQDHLAIGEQGGGWTETHNAFLQVGADLGVPGLLVHLLLIWQVFKGVRQPRKELEGLPQGRELLALRNGIQIALLAYVVAAFFHPVPYHFYFYYIAGLAIAFQEMTRPFRVQAQRLTPA